MTSWFLQKQKNTILILPFGCAMQWIMNRKCRSCCFLHLFVKINRVNGHFYASTVFLLIEIKRTMNVISLITKQVFLQAYYVSTTSVLSNQVQVIQSKVFWEIFVHCIVDAYQSSVIIYLLVNISFTPDRCLR